MQRNYHQTRVLIDYAEFIAKSSDDTLICVNQGVLGAIRVLVRTYGLRNINWVTAYGASGYTSPDAVQQDKIDELVSEFLGDTEMSTCSDLVAAINNLAMSNCIGCNGGSGGAGGDGAPASLFQDVDWNVPIGFDGLNEYKTYKCKAANIIRQDLEDDLTWLEGASLLDLVWPILTLRLLTPISYGQIVPFTAFVSALETVGQLDTIASELLTALSTFPNDLTCGLYLATDYADAQVAFDDWAVTASLSSNAKSLLLYLLTTDNVNRLFEANNILNMRTADSPIDCSTCATIVTPSMGLCTGQNPTTFYWFEPVVGRQYTINSVHNTNGYDYAIWTTKPPGTSPCNEAWVTLDSGLNLSSAYGSAYENCLGQFSYTNNIPGSVGLSVLEAQLVNITLGGPSQITFTFDGWGP